MGGNSKTIKERIPVKFRIVPHFRGRKAVMNRIEYRKRFQGNWQRSVS